MAEKKSTGKAKPASKKRETKKAEEPKPAPKKHKFKKVEESKPASEVRQEDETIKSKRSIDWLNILEKSSVIITIATVILYIIGWSYELNWYKYFGISLSQVSISIPQVLLRSMLTISIIALLIFVVNFVYSFFGWIVYLAGYVFSLGKLAMFQKKTLSKKDISRIFSLNQNAPKNKWLIIMSFTFLLTFLSTINNPYRYALNLMIDGINAIPPLWGFVISSTLVWSLYLLPLPKNNAPSAANESFVSFVESRRVLVTILGVVYFILVVFMSGRMALSDAAVGKKDVVLEDVQKVVLVGPKILSYMPDLEKHCDESGNCIYGLFGLIAENNNLYFLVKLNADQTGFDQNSGLYIVPNDSQSGVYFIMPESLPILTITASPTAITSTPTSLPVPTSRVTATPRPSTNTATPTLTKP